MSRSDSSSWSWVKYIDEDVYRPRSEVKKFIRIDDRVYAVFTDGEKHEIEPGLLSDFSVECDLKAKIMDKPEWLI